MSDLLAELRAERQKHDPDPHVYADEAEEASWCKASCCDSDWPCLLSRALDCAIAGLTRVRDIQREDSPIESAMSRAYHGGGWEEHAEK